MVLSLSPRRVDIFKVYRLAILPRHTLRLLQLRLSCPAQILSFSLSFFEFCGTHTHTQNVFVHVSRMQIPVAMCPCPRPHHHLLALRPRSSRPNTLGAVLFH